MLARDHAIVRDHPGKQFIQYRHPSFFMTFYLIVEHDIHMNVPVTGMTKTSHRHVVLFLELASERE